MQLSSHSPLPTPHSLFSLNLATELLATYGSPLYVYEGDRLRQTIRQITHAIPYPRTQFRFASVTNGNLSLLRIFQEEGWGLHANTPGDIYLGLQAGFHPNQIVYSGSNLNRDEMEQIFRWGVTTFNLDSLSQVELCCQVSGEMRRQRAEGRGQKGRHGDAETRRHGDTAIGNRGQGTGDRELKADFPHSSLLTPHSSLTIQNSQFKTQNLHPPPPIPHSSFFPLPRLGLRLNLPELTGDSRIGVRPEEFSAAIALAHKAGLKLTGLHFYRGTGTNATAAFTQIIDTVLATAQQLPDWEYLDFGGGFGYPYRHNGAAFDWEQFGRELSDRLDRLNRPIDLIIEPGRAAIAGCATLLCQVVSVKWQNEKQIVGVDTTVANLSVPSVHGGYREIVAWKGRQETEGTRGDAETRRYGDAGNSKLKIQNSKLKTLFPPTRHPTDICGNTTYSRDYLGKNCLLPALEIGDILAILDVGAYGYAMSSHFLHRPRPAEVLLEAGTHRLIRKREDYSILLENQVID